MRIKPEQIDDWIVADQYKKMMESPDREQYLMTEIGSGCRARIIADRLMVAQIHAERAAKALWRTVQFERMGLPVEK